jgi:hypothetical protein
MSEPINYVQLMQTNSIMEKYNTKILMKIQSNTVPETQKVFMANFYCYTKYDKHKDFIINLETVYEFLGYSRIDICLKALKKNFTEGTHYTIGKAAPELGGPAFAEENEEHCDYQKPAPPSPGADKNTGGAGLNKNIVKMTIKCFKDFCIIVKNPIMLNYYEELEHVLFETLIEELYEKDLEISKNTSELNNKDKENENNLLLNFSNKYVVYLILVEHNIIKFGHTGDIRERLKDHRSKIGPDIILKSVYETVYNRDLECMIKNDPILSPKIIEKVYKKNQTELIQLDKSFTYKDLCDRLEILKKTEKKGYIDNLIAENQLLKAKLENIEKTGNIGNTDKYDKDSVYKINPENSKYLPVIAYDISKKREDVYKTFYGLKKLLGSETSTIINYIDTNKQIRGYVLRTAKCKEYWVPPDNFKFYAKMTPSPNNILIKRTDKCGPDKKTYIYNSITEAALFLQQEIDHKEITGEKKESENLKKKITELTGKSNVQTKHPYVLKYKWSRVTNVGTMVKNTFVDVTNGQEVEVAENVKETEETEEDEGVEETESEAHDNKQLIIMRNVLTSEEFVHTEGYTQLFYKKYGLRRTTVPGFIDKMRVYKIYTIRSTEYPKWIPPPNLIIMTDYTEEAEGTEETTGDEDSGSRCTNIKYWIKVEYEGVINYYSKMTDIQLHLFPDHDAEKMRKNISHKIRGYKNPSELSKYVFTKLESCGSFMHEDGTIEIIEERPFVDIKNKRSKV